MTVREFLSKMRMSSDIECVSIRVRNLVLTELTRDDLVKKIYNGTGEFIIETFRIAYGQIVIYIKEVSNEHYEVLQRLQQAFN